jgi:hypothetical protein
MRALTRMRHHTRPRRGLAKIADQLGHIFGETVAPLHPAPQGMVHGLIATGRAAKAQINPVSVNRGKRAKLLCNRQRRVVRQHDAPRAHTDARGVIRHMPDQHRCRGRGDPRHIVMLCHPVAIISRRFGALCQINRIRNGLAGI